MNKRIVVPGEEIGTSEEYLPGKCTYELDGKIFSKAIGFFVPNIKERIADVESFNSPTVISDSDIVVGFVSDIKSSAAIINIVKVLGKKRGISGDKLGYLHISKICSSYVEKITDHYRLMDIVLAKVIGTKPTLQLETIAPELGVIKAICPKCKKNLEIENNELFCKKCERKEMRKIAKDYGKGIL
ncbi:MAG: exosome complex RNA-binding protein Csl4 [Candidatus Thermoplasmatota archaeon]